MLPISLFNVQGTLYGFSMKFFLTKPPSPLTVTKTFPKQISKIYLFSSPQSSFCSIFWDFSGRFPRSLHRMRNKLRLEFKKIIKKASLLNSFSFVKLCYLDVRQQWSNLYISLLRNSSLFCIRINIIIHLLV